MKVAMDMMAVLKAAKEAGAPLGDPLWKQLYKAAQSYEYASEKVVELTKVVEECCAEIRNGRRSFYSIGDKAHELEQKITERDDAERLFHILCEVVGFEVIAPEKTAA
jgi:hypothetical protein